MQNQYLQRGSTAPAIRLYFYTTADGTAATVLFNAASLALVYAQDSGANVALTLVTATLGTYVANGFIVRGGGVHDLYLPTAAAAGTPKSLTITSTGLPTGVSMIACIVAMGADDISATAPTEATITTAVVAGEASSFTAIPAAVRSNLAVELARIDVAVSSVSGGGGGYTPTAISAQVMTDLAGAGGTGSRGAIAIAVEAQILDNFAAIPTPPSAATIAAAVAAPSAATIAAAVAAPSAATIAAAVAAPSAATIASAVDAILLDNFAGVVPPTAAQNSTQVMADFAGAGGATARAAFATTFLGTVLGAGRTVKEAFQFLRNRVSRNVGTGVVTVYAEDDSTAAWTTQTTTSTGAAPVINSDPT